MAKKGAGVTTLDYDSGYGLQGTATSATASASLAVTSTCTNSSSNSTQYGYLASTPPRNDTHDDNSTPGIISSGWNRSFTRYYGIARARVIAPTTPNGDGVRSSDTPPTYSPTETAITIDGRNNSSSQPWHLQKFNFLENKWYYYITEFTHFNQSHSVEFDYYVHSYVCNTCGTLTCPSWSGPNPQTAISPTVTHKGVHWSTASGTVGGTLNARIQLLAGSHVRLTGSGGKSIGHGTLGSTTAYLNLPDTFYTLMNDDSVTFGNIKYNSNGGNTVDPILGRDAVFGINKALDKDLKTKTDGGTILIGATMTGSSSGQDKITIVSPTTTAAGNPFGFNSRANSCNTTVYTGTWIPLSGTGNLGNYGTTLPNPTEAQRAITVDANMKIAGASAEMDNGKIQVYNQIGNIFYNNKIPKVPSTKAGNFLIMARDTVEMTATSTMTNNIEGAGNITIMAGKVKLLQNEAITLTGSNSTGHYNVIAYATDGLFVGVSPSVGQLSFVPPCSTGTYSWCNVSQQAAERIRTPWPDFTSTGIGTQGGQSYATPCMPAFAAVGSLGDRGGNITFNGTAGSTVNVEAKGSARWQAYVSISVAPGKTMNWEVKSTAGSGATASWLAGGNIGLGAGSTANWKTASTHAGERVFWDAGNDINTNSLTATWENSGQGGMHWRAGNAINAGTYSNPLVQVDWKSTSAATDGNMRWEAKAIRVDNGQTNPLTFTQESSKGYTDWNAEDSILVKIGKGVTFTNKSSDSNHAGRMVWLAAKGNIHTKDTTDTNTNILSFVQDHNDAGLNAWKAGHDILTDNVISFENRQQANKSNMQWYACHDIRTNHRVSAADANDAKKVTFDNKSEGHMIWHAGNDIDTRSKTEFISQQNSKGSVTWYAGNDIHTRLGTTVNSVLGDGVNFKQEGEGRTIWQAVRDITTHNAVHFQFTNNAKDWASLGLLAGRNITLGGVAGEYENNHPSLRNEFKVETEVNDTVVLHARNGYILTNSLVNIERKNNKPALTKLWAGCGTYHFNGSPYKNDIDIEHTFNYTETNGQGSQNNTGGALIDLYAENDILSNQVCDNRQAPITFTVPAGSRTITRWVAERNINTRGRVDFLYGPADKMGPITWLSRGGYIQTERPVTIAYKSDSLISFRAEFWRFDPTNALPANFTTARRGNIHFYDSVDINRNNTAGGITEIKAENHIWTAMLNYVDQQSTGDTMDIISHSGDIYLGYNDGLSNQSAGLYPDQRYVSFINDNGIFQRSPFPACSPAASPVSYDKNRFTYSIPGSNKKGHLWIKAGWEVKTDRNIVPDDGSRKAGGNIYFTHIDVKQATGSIHPTEITIPFSGLWRCGNAGTQDSSLYNRAGGSRQRYENSGIISGVARCFLSYPGNASQNTVARDTGLIYRGAIGNLTVDAGNRGNIIFNKGAYLSFEDPSSTGDVVFRTRFGDIDMRNPFNVDTLRGSLAFLAQIENLADLSKLKGEKAYCSCEEERNNVYLQDFEYKAHGSSGSVFIAADNNIKLNYGGLQNIGTRHDPFLSQDYEACPDGGLKKIGPGYKAGGGCGDSLHCDADSNENKARTFLMKFDKDANGTAITSGGFGAVASDYIDVYKKFAYYGGSGSGMGTVPTTGTLHGEGVSGYGLFMKTQANKGNWDTNIFENTPTCPTPCDGTNCGHDYLHMVSRMTFHDDAYIEAHNQKVMLWSPVVETFGLMTLNTEKDAGGNTEITLKADSLIFHDDFIKKGNHVKLSTWSGLHKDLPIMKFGHMRKTPPFIEAKRSDCQTYTECVPCYRYIRYSKDPLHMLDTITIKFGDGAYLERLNTVVFDHTVLTCLTDSFDHVKGGEVQHAQIFTDTFKIRHQVDLFADEKHERDAHLELISEEQMGSKNYAGIYTKHLHMEPIGACGTPYSELWTSDDLALDVITTSIFGGFGFIHSDVHVENGAHLNAGFTSLRLKGMCYEHKCGTQRMKDLRLDVGAQLHFSVGTTKGLNGEYSDAIEVDRLTTYGSVDVNIEIRPCEKMEKRCYPIIYYKSVTPNSLNQLKLNPRRVVIDGEEYPLHLNIGTDGVVYVCVGDAQPVDINRTVTLPSVSGVKTDPVAGIWDVKSRGNFKFKATYSGSKPLAVRTNRTVNGVPEMLTGTKNANGEYEYIVPNVQQEITLSIGPDYVSNQLLAGTAVWSHGEMIYIRVDRADIASIYSVAGQLVRKVDLPEGDTSIPMSRGAYVITLKDGSVHKVIVK